MDWIDWMGVGRSVGHQIRYYAPAPKSTLLLHHPESALHAAVDFASKKLDVPAENADRLKVLLDEATGILRSDEFEAPLQWDAAAPEASISDILRVHE
jgi:hypothetical protein